MPDQHRRSIREELAKLWETSQSIAHERISEIEAIATLIGSGTASESQTQTARDHAHKLAGSLGTFGFPAASVVARDIEREVVGPNPSSLKLVQLVADLTQSLVQAVQDESLESEAGHPRRADFLLVSTDQTFIEKVHTAAQSLGLVFGFWGIAASTETTGLVLLVDYDGLPDVGFIKNAVAQGHHVYVASSSTDFQTRLELVRDGAVALLPKSDVYEIINRMSAHMVPIRTLHALVVDDDPVILELVEAVLSEDRIEVMGLTDPMVVWETIERMSPDVIILDVDMPGLDGIELCGLIRAEPRWADMPIIIQTARDDLQTVRAALMAGANDFVPKQQMGEELAVRVWSLVDPSSSIALRNRGGKAPRASIEAPERSHDIAVVEDDEMVGEILRSTLSANGYSVRWLSDGQMAVDELSGERPCRVKLILLDVNLPGWDGLAVLRTLARDGVLDDTNVMMVTGRSSEPEVLEALSAGAVDHIAKPFSIPVLLERVRRALAA